MNIPSKPWTNKEYPKRILAIRMQAMGDTIITLPYLQALKRSLPADTQIDLLIREEDATIPKAIELFNKVHIIRGGRNFKKQFIYACLLLPGLMLRRYDVVVDLQNNRISKLMRICLMPKAWSEFDKVSHVPAGERTRLTIESVGLGPNHIDPHFTFKRRLPVDKILLDNGWDGKSKLVILNPAGAFVTRNWALDNYIAFARMWSQRFPDTQFLVVGVQLIAKQAKYFEAALGDKLIDLVEKTTPAEAFAIVQRAELVLSEDSGLMHMAWVSDKPTVALFGSTRSYWSGPLNKRSVLLSSHDLPCGDCLLERCTYGDVHCLTRYTPELVFEKALSLLLSPNVS